jgi:hypothetical protein
MSSHIDFKTMPANVPVLCIPRVYSNISESRIRSIFEDLNMGVLDRIDIIASKPSEKGVKFNRVFVHFLKWNNSENSNAARERLLNGKDIKIIYDDPWFWKISAYREVERKVNLPRHKSKASVRIEFDSDEEKDTSSKRPLPPHQRPNKRPCYPESPKKKLVEVVEVVSETLGSKEENA